MNWPRLLCKPFGTGVRRVKGMVAFTLVKHPRSFEQLLMVKLQHDILLFLFLFLELKHLE